MHKTSINPLKLIIKTINLKYLLYHNSIEAWTAIHDFILETNFLN